MKTTKGTVVEIKTKAKKCMQNREDANNIIDILCYSQDEDAAVVLATIKCLQQIFSHFLTSGEMTSPKFTGDGGVTKEEQFATWLIEQYRTACEILIDKLDCENSKIQEAALVALMKFIELEGLNPLQSSPPLEFAFPFKILQDVMTHLLSHKFSMEPLILRLSEVTDHDDLRFFVLKTLHQKLRKTPIKDRNSNFLSNILYALENLEFPIDEEKPLTNFLTKSEEDRTPHPKVSSLIHHKKTFTGVWMELLRSELTPALYRRVLTRLDDKVIPFLSSPLVLSDFLTQSYNIGGAVSLLALKGLFILINKYNLDYPDFYPKLYTLFDSHVFQAKYRARFFYLADIFLSSTHLPSYLVGSFIKRLARLAWRAPPAGAKLSLVFICNLMVRHPNCSILIHRTDCTEMDSDPFLEEECHPAKTRAMESSLWEIKALQNHFSPEVALEAQKFNHPITQEQDLTELLDSNTEEMIEREIKKKPKTIPCTDYCSGGVLGPSTSKMRKFFTLT